MNLLVVNALHIDRQSTPSAATWAGSAGVCA